MGYRIMQVGAPKVAVTSPSSRLGLQWDARSASRIWKMNEAAD
jgi:hypothetical protein